MKKEEMAKGGTEKGAIACNCLCISFLSPFLPPHSDGPPFSPLFLHHYGFRSQEHDHALAFEFRLLLDLAYFFEALRKAVEQ